MNKKHKKKILQKLQFAISKVELDLEKHNGDTVKAAANKTATCINILHPYADLFDESFKKKMLIYMNLGRAAEEGDESSMTKLGPLVEPTHRLLIETLDKMVKKLG